MSSTRRRRKAALRARWVKALRVRADNLLGRDQLEHVETYACRHCGQVSMIAGGGEPWTDYDWDADQHFDDEIRRHESGECRVVVGR